MDGSDDGCELKLGESEGCDDGEEEADYQESGEAHGEQPTKTGEPVTTTTKVSEGAEITGVSSEDDGMQSEESAGVAQKLAPKFATGAKI